VRIRNLKNPSERTSILASATVVAAIISALAGVLTAVLPWLLKVNDQPLAAGGQPIDSVRVPAKIQSGEKIGASVPLAPSPAITPIPNLTFGAWSIVNSIDDAGTDFSGSTLKFISQRDVASGLEATGFFEWRSGAQVLGREYVVANFDATTRHIFIEGKSVESPTGTLAIGSFSARVSDDGRQLLEGTWGDTPGNQRGILGKWQARR
jgi:hypothetical protein